MSPLRTAFRVLFAAAIAAQLSAPVLAANAKALNLYCPAHAADRPVADMHAGHGAGGNQHGHEQPAADESRHERNLFDVSCCSVHLTGTMPALSVSFAGLFAKWQGIAADDPAAVSPATSDPPPRRFV